MMNRFKKLSLFLLLLAPLSALASGNNGFFRLFAPGEGDLSVKYLGELFGTVGGVLAGSGGQMMGQLFSVLNSGILVVAGLFLTYTVFMTVVNTAQDGEIMGRKFSSAWIAVRTAAGIVFLIPSKATGYSLVQVIVMWVVIQGVGLANQAWDRTIDYLGKEGGVLYVKEPTNPESAAKVIPTATGILKAEVCMYKTRDLLAQKENEMKEVAAGNTGSTPINMIGNQPSVGYGFNTDKRVVNFGSKSKDGGYNSECGEISWSNISTSQQSQQYIEAGVRQMVIDLSSTARRIAESTSANDNNFKQQAGNSIAVAVQSYANIITPALNKTASNATQKTKDDLETAKKQGWILAGSYYRHIAALNSDVKRNYDAFIPKIASLPPTNDTDKLEKNKDGSANVISMVDRKTVSSAVKKVDFDKDAKAALNSVLSASGGEKGPLQDQKLAVNLYIIGSGGAMALLGLAGGPHISVALGIVTGLMVLAANLWMSSMAATIDPIMNLHQFGTQLLGIGTSLWLAMTGVLFLGTLVYGLIPSIQGPAPAVQNSVRWFTGTIGVLLASIFSMGLMLAVYIPMIPYLIFTFAGIGWFIAVLEAMIAAPLVALGVTHPEGHDLLGKAEQAVMLLLSIFLRPVLLIIGLIAAMILSTVAVRLINSGFAVIVGGTGEGNFISGITGIFSIIGLMAIYTMLMIYVVNTCFNMIPTVAEKVMRWLGLHPESSGYQQELQAIKGATEQSGSMAGKAGGSMASAGEQSGWAGRDQQGNKINPWTGKKSGGSASGQQGNT